MNDADQEYREKIAGDEAAADRVARDQADDAKLWAAQIEQLLADNAVNRFTVQTRYGSIELPLDELWFNDETKTVHLSVRVPAGYDLVKL